MIDSTVPVDLLVVVGAAVAIPEALPESGRKPRSFFLPLQSQSYKEMDAQKLFRFSLGFYGIKKTRIHSLSIHSLICCLLTKKEITCKSPLRI